MKDDRQIVCIITLLVLLYFCVCFLSGCKEQKMIIKTDGTTTTKTETTTKQNEETKTTAKTDEETTGMEVRVELEDGVVVTADDIEKLLNGTTDGKEIKAKSITIKKTEKNATTTTETNKGVKTTTDNKTKAQTQEKTKKTTTEKEKAPKYIEIALYIFTLFGIFWLIYKAKE